MSLWPQTISKPLSKRYGIVLMGIGHRGYNTYFMCVASSQFASIVAVCDTSESAVSEFRAKHPEIPAYTSLNKLLQNHTPDFAIVCVPHKYHTECVSQLSAAGVSVLKEKPVANSFEEFGALMQLPVKIGVTFQKRFEPRFVQFQKLLKSVGEITSFRATLTMNIKDLESTWRAEDNVGVTEDLGCHMLDLIVWLLGAPSTVTAQQVHGVRRFQQYGGDDVSNIIMSWNKTTSSTSSEGENIIGHVHLSRVAHKTEEVLVVTGIEGTLLLDGKKVVLLNALGTQILEMQDTSTKEDVIRDMVQMFGRYVSEASAEYPGSLKSLADTVSIADATRRSFESGQPECLQPVPGIVNRSMQASLDGQHFIWPMITPQVVEAVVNQMHSSLSIYNRSGVYEKFEDRWQKMHNLKHALVCNSGTTAIHSMFEAIDLRPGDEVLCPVYTFFATATPMLQYGAIPVFCDSLPDGNFNPEEIFRKVTNKTKAVIVTHMWGLPCDMPTIVKNARQLGIKVLEDCSHAHGAKVGGKLVGSWGDMAAWSLQAKKNITGGQAGVIGTDNTDYYLRAITLGHFNERAKQEVPENHPWRKFWLTGLGLNMRAHPLSIAMANQQLDCMPSWMSQREEYAALLSERIGRIPFLRVPKVKNADQDRHAWYAFMIQFEVSKAPQGLTRDKFVAALKERGLKEVDIPASTRLLNDLPIFTHTHEAFPRFGDKPWRAPQTGFHVAQEFFDSSIKLPVWVSAADRPIVEHYADAFLLIAEEFMSKEELTSTVPYPGVSLMLHMSPKLSLQDCGVLL